MLSYYKEYRRFRRHGFWKALRLAIRAIHKGY